MGIIHLSKQKEYSPKVDLNSFFYAAFLRKELNMKYLFSFLLAFSCLSSFAQVNKGEVQVDAVFEAFIELKIVDDPKVSWTFDSFDDYRGDNSWPVHRQIDFQVASSTSFLVQGMMTDLVNGTNGAKLDKRNFGLRIGARRDHSAERFKRWDFAAGDGDRVISGSGEVHSAIFISMDQPRTLLLPGPEGNAGDFEENEYILRIGLGSSNILVLNDLPPLYRQNIQPGTYTGTLTITAIGKY